MIDDLKYVGRLSNKEAGFVHTDGAIAVEKDQRHLVDATPEEKREIYRTWPGLIDKPTGNRNNFPKIKGNAIDELRDTIAGLERMIAEKDSLIRSLKFANSQKDEFIGQK